MKRAELPLYVREHERLTIGFLQWWYPWVRAQLLGEAIDVPCEGCGARCCLTSTIEMLPGDDPSRYRLQADGTVAKRADGACTHLTADGLCEVYAQRPWLCRVFDCRMFPAALTIVLTPEDNEELTLCCEAGLTRFEVVARTAADLAAVRAVKQVQAQLSVREPGMDGNGVTGVSLITWPRVTGGPAASYLAGLERRAKPGWLATFAQRTATGRSGAPEGLRLSPASGAS